MPIGPLLNRIVDTLTKRRDALDRAISALQDLVATEGPRRGRRPKILKPFPVLDETDEPADEPPRRKAQSASAR